MKFDEIKSAMDKPNKNDLKVPKSLKSLGESNLPIQRIRKTVMVEIITQLLVIAVFFTYPFIVKMHEQPQAMYLILMFLVCTITSGYVLKMIGFFRQTGRINYNSKDTIRKFIFDLKILLEIYKTAVVAVSITLPLPVAALLLGQKKSDLVLYNKFFSLQFSPAELVLLAFAFLLLAVVFYFITVMWSNWLYERQISNLEQLLAEFNDEC